MIKSLFFLLFCFASVNVGLSQEINSQDILKNYDKELNLDNEQREQIKFILEKYSPLFADNQLKTRDFNALMKKETLEIYKILSPEQFTSYKNLKKSIEPSKKYRFDNN